MKSCRCPLLLRVVLYNAALLLLTTLVNAQMVSFTDSRGLTVARNLADGPPKIVVNANGALSLYHLGMSSDQLVGVYDHWTVRGSTIDLDDASTFEGTEFAIDPTAEEIQFLERTENLSPECVGSNSNGCFLNVDSDRLAKLDFDYLLLLRNGLSPAFDLDEQVRAMGKQLLWVDDRYEQNTGCYGTSGAAVFEIANPSACNANSLIDAVQQLEKLAYDFLGIESNAQVQAAQQNMCRTAANFVARSQDMHQRGILAAAASLRPNNGGSVNVFSPTSYPHLRTLEELGFPLLHADETFATGESFTLGTWFPACVGADAATCADLTPAYPVDFWLIDSRAYASVQLDLDGFTQQIPDPALLKNQFSYWVFNDAAVSYTNIARFLQDILDATNGIQRIHSAATPTCTAADSTSRTHNTVASLAGGQFVCFNSDQLQSLYLECPATVGDGSTIRATSTGVRLSGATVLLVIVVAAFVQTI